MFKTGGTNAYPVEIEQHLARHPAIAQSVVVGVPDQRLGEVGYAFVQLRESPSVTAEEIVGHCRGQIADYKVPHYVCFVQEFPRTSTGKIMRAELARQAREEIEKGLASKALRK
jgi:fatty-acyl-CoA synthase